MPTSAVLTKAAEGKRPSDLERASAGRLFAATSRVQKSPGEILFVEGDVADKVYEVAQGMVRLYKMLPDGRRQITGFLTTGDLLGLAPERTYVYTADALTQVTLCHYTRAAVERLIDELPGFARQLLNVASHELQAAQNQMLLLGRKSACEKVASFLLTMARRNGGNRVEVTVPMTRNDMADYLGLTVETVCRTLTRMRQEDVIAILSQGRIVFRNLARLEAYAIWDSDKAA
jgi:CRP/FNR family transcriptional regulator, anaerobic regulatory protein